MNRKVAVMKTAVLFRVSFQDEKDLNQNPRLKIFVAEFTSMWNGIALHMQCARNVYMKLIAE